MVINVKNVKKKAAIISGKDIENSLGAKLFWVDSYRVEVMEKRV